MNSLLRYTKKMVQRTIQEIVVVVAGYDVPGAQRGRGEVGGHVVDGEDGGVAWWLAMATMTGGAAAMDGLGFGTARGRKGSRGVRWRLQGEEKVAAAMARFIGHQARVWGSTNDLCHPCHGWVTRR